MNRCDRKTMVIILVVVGMLPASAWANYGSNGQHQPQGPPQEAIDACREKSEGAAVVITTPRGDTIKSTCKQIDGQLVAVPESFPGSGNGEPPKGRGNEH